MTHVTCRLTAKNRDQLRNPIRSVIDYGLPLPFTIGNFSKRCISQPTVCILYTPSYQKQPIWAPLGTNPTISFSCQSATPCISPQNCSFRRSLLYAVCVGLNRFWLTLLYVFMIVSSYFSYACSSVYFTFWTTGFNCVACAFVTWFSIDTQ